MRADSYFAAKYGSRTRAKEMLCRGLILRGGKALSPSDDVNDGDAFLFLDEGAQPVSRGGYKLERALQVFGERVDGDVFADLGASTGGFTEVLLAHGARRVYAVDVGRSQLDARLASDGRVVVMDATNARYLTRESFPEQLDGIVSDVSFISLRLILPAIAALLEEGGRAFLLFKPQFECGGKGLGKGGILPRRYHRALLSAFFDDCISNGLAPRAAVNAPIAPRKNIEYVVFVQRAGTPLSKEAFLSMTDSLFEERKI